MKTLLEDVIAALCGIRMLAQLESLVEPQTRWEAILPDLDDLIERATAVLQHENAKTVKPCQ